MTDDEAIARMVRERGELQRKLACLRGKIGLYHRSLLASAYHLGDASMNQSRRGEIEDHPSAEEARKALEEFDAGKARLDELNRCIDEL